MRGHSPIDASTVALQAWSCTPTLASARARCRSVTTGPPPATSQSRAAPRPGGVELVTADRADSESLDRACAGAQHLCLSSSPPRDQITLETNGIDAADRAGIEHVVEMSNIPSEGLDGGGQGNDRAI